MGDNKRLRIDAHVHLIAVDRVKHKCYVSEKKKRGIEAWYLRRLSRVDRDAPDDELDIAYAARLAELVGEAEHIDRVVAFAMDGLYESSGKLDPRTEVMVSNDWVMEAASRHPGLFLFGASIHPARPDALDELDRCAEAGAVCVKWVPPSQNIDASDPRYRRFYERMLHHGLALSSHTGYEHAIHAVDQTLGNPERLRLPLEVGLKVVAGHAGMTGWYHREEYFPNFVKMVAEFDNLFGDTSAILSPERSVYRSRLFEAPGVMERLIEGTDFPTPQIAVLWPLALGPARAAGLQMVKNPFDRSVLTKKAVGFPEEHFLRAHDIFLGRSQAADS
jgi:hypothetical protein